VSVFKRGSLNRFETENESTGTQRTVGDERRIKNDGEVIRECDRPENSPGSLAVRLIRCNAPGHAMRQLLSVNQMLQKLKRPAVSKLNQSIWVRIGFEQI
jgi:hypothetical protein